MSLKRCLFKDNAQLASSEQEGGIIESRWGPDWGPVRLEEVIFTGNNYKYELYDSNPGFEEFGPTFFSDDTNSVVGLGDGGADAPSSVIPAATTTTTAPLDDAPDYFLSLTISTIQAIMGVRTTETLSTRFDSSLWTV